MAFPLSSSLCYGSRDRFMIELSFEDDPSPDQNSLEERASWGALKIWADGYNLCTHYEAGELRESVNWNWWGLLNWLHDNWNPLLHEQALPVENKAEWAADAMWEINRPETFDKRGGWDEVAEASADEWFRHHCLWACREGGLVPNIAIRRLYDRAEVSWTNHSAPGSPPHFRFQLTTGGIRLPVGEVATPLHQFLTHAAGYVAAVAETPAARALVRKVGVLNDINEFNPRLAWLAGFGSRKSDYVKKFRRRIDSGLDLAAKTAGWFFPEPSTGLVVSGHCQGALMFGAVAPALNDDDRMAIADAMISHNAPAGKAKYLWQHTEKLDLGDMPKNERPWQEGYDLANAWIMVCKQDSTKPLNLEEHLQSLGVTVKEALLSDPHTSGVAILMEGRAPLILVNPACEKHGDAKGHQFHSGVRFTLAHELCHLLIDRDSGSELAMVSGPWAPKAIEGRANAFAAALLMPDALIDAAYADQGCHPSAGGVEELLKAAKAMEVSPDALSRHLHNRGYIDALQRDVLRAQFGKSAY